MMSISQERIVRDRAGLRLPRDGNERGVDLTVVFTDLLAAWYQTQPFAYRAAVASS